MSNAKTRPRSELGSILCPHVCVVICVGIWAYRERPYYHEMRRNLKSKMTDTGVQTRRCKRYSQTKCGDDGERQKGKDCMDAEHVLQSKTTKDPPYTQEETSRLR